jgi:hypothetical protein
MNLSRDGVKGKRVALNFEFTQKEPAGQKGLKKKIPQSP